jgi:hypothetical protein
MLSTIFANALAGYPASHPGTSYSPADATVHAYTVGFTAGGVITQRIAAATHSGHGNAARAVVNRAAGLRAYPPEGPLKMKIQEHGARW